MQTQPAMSSSRQSIEYSKALVFGAWAAGGASLGSWVIQLVIGLLAALVLLILGQADHLTDLFTGHESIGGVLVAMGILFGSVGAGASIALLWGYSLYMKRGLQFWQSTYRGALIGFTAGFIAGVIAQFTFNVAQGIYGPATDNGFSGWPIESCRIICWGIAGGLMGFGLSFRIPNLGRLRGLVGGTVGGLIGGLVYVLFILATGAHTGSGSFLGQAAIGLFIGCMVVFAETMFREAWLEIRYGPNEVRNVTLGRESVSIGGDRRACTVLARNVPPVAYRYRLENGRILCEDIAGGLTVAVQPGDVKAVGNLTVAVCAAGSAVRTVTGASSVSAFSIRLSAGKTIKLGIGTRLVITDVPGLEPSRTRHAVAEVVPNPGDPTVLGLKNLSRNLWTATTPAGEPKRVEPDRSIRLARGTRINFGSVTGEIV